MAWIERVKNVSQPAWRVGRRGSNGKKQHSDIFYVHADAIKQKATWDLEKVPTNSPQTPIESLWQKYMAYCVNEKKIRPATVVNKQHMSKHGLAYFKKVGDLTQERCKEWRQALGETVCVIGPDKGRPISTNTIKNNLRVMKAFVKWLVLEGILSSDPMVRLSVGRPVRTGRAYSKRVMNEIDRTAKAYPRFYRVYKVLERTGARVGEILEKLEWEKIGRDGVVELCKTKNGKDRTIYLKPKVRELLGKPSEGRVFANYTRAMFYDDWKLVRAKVVKKLRISGRIVPHHFRHTYATHYAKKFKDPTSLQKAMGWEDIKTADTYIHLTREWVTRDQKAFDFVE